MTPLITVGVPTFNRPEGLNRVLEEIRSQTYQKLEIIVSDNASPNPAVNDVVSAHMDADPRVKVFRHETNVGIGKNFETVFGLASGEFFMWAADDDGHEKEFVEKLIQPLMGDPRLGLSFCNFDVLYPDGSSADLYPSFADSFRPFSQKAVFSKLCSLLFQPENRGKANLFYSVFRRSVLLRIPVGRYLRGSAWGYDMLVVFHALALSEFHFCEDLLFHVGIPFDNQSASSKAFATTESSYTRRKKLAVYFLEQIQIVGCTVGISTAERVSIIGRLCARCLNSVISEKIC